MYRYCFRMIHNDFKNWLPLIGVVSFISFLVGSCIYQMVWSYSSTFVRTVQSQGFKADDFHIVSQSIYIIVFTLAFLSLTIVGNSTVRRTRATFAQWKLIGASKSDVRNCLLGMILYISLLGSLPGAFFSFLLSYYTVPVFNKMAAQGFEVGTNIVLPDYSPSYIGLVLAVVISILTCCAGTILPIYKSGNVQPIDVMKKTDVDARSRVAKVLSIISVLFIFTLLIIFIIFSVNLQKISIETLFNASLQSGILATLGMYFSITLLVVPGISKLSKLFLNSNRYRVGVAFSSIADKFFNNHHSLTYLFIGVSSIGVISTVVSYLKNVSKEFGISEVNSIDTLVLTTLVSATCLIVSIAVSQLNAGLVNEDQKLLKISGYTFPELIGWHILTSLIHAALAVLLTLPPVLFTSMIASIMYRAAVGYTYMYFPAIEILLSFLGCWAIFFALNFFNNIGSMCKSIGKELR